jgi:hypothetical protein
MQVQKLLSRLMARLTAGGGVMATQGAKATGPTSKNVAPADLVRRFFSDVMSGESKTAPAQVLGDKVVVHGAGRWDVKGRAGVVKLLGESREKLPHFGISINSILELDDLVICRWTGLGSVTGIWPIPVVGLEVPGAVSVFRVSQQRIVEIWSLDPSFDPSDWEEDDDDGPVGGAPAGPRWVPPKPTSKPPSDR